MDAMQIMDALSQLAAEGIPELKAVYLDLAPVGALRPCLLIESASESVKDANAALVEISAGYTLTLFDSTDDYAQSGTKRLIELRTRLLGLFRQGYLRVGDRALSVKAANGERDWDRAFIDVQLHYMDDRGGRGETQPLIETVTTDVQPVACKN